MICVVELSKQLSIARGGGEYQTVRVIGPFSSLEEGIMWLLGESHLREQLNPSLDMPISINTNVYEFKEMEHPFTSQKA
jgi:hypothetical protein